MVEQPTRGNNILYLFATNKPSLVRQIKIIPGISDHEIVSVELSLPFFFLNFFFEVMV